MKDDLQVGFIYANVFKHDEVASLLDDFNGSKVGFKSLSREVRLYACFDWLIPSAFIVVVFKPYFEAFLKEAGKDHYELVKQWLCKVVKKGKSLSGNVVKDRDPQSGMVSVYFQTKTAATVKLLFDERLSLFDWQNAVVDMLNIVASHFEDGQNDKLSAYLMKNDIVNGIVFAIIDSTTKEIVFSEVRLGNDEIAHVLGKDPQRLFQ